MQIFSLDVLEGDRRYHSLRRIKACAPWRRVSIPAPDCDRQEALSALIREAEEHDADAIVGLDFAFDRVNGLENCGVPLRRFVATGVAIKFDRAA